MKSVTTMYLTLLFYAMFHSFITETANNAPKSTQSTQTLAHKLTNILASTAPTVVKHSDGSYHVYLNNKDLTSFVFDGPTLTPLYPSELKQLQPAIKQAGNGGLLMICVCFENTTTKDKSIHGPNYKAFTTCFDIYEGIPLFSTPTKLATLPIYINTSINHTLKNQNTTYKNILQKVWYLLITHPSPTCILRPNKDSTLYLHAGFPPAKKT